MTSAQTKHQILSPLLISLLLFTLSHIPQVNSLTSLPTRLVHPFYSPLSQLGQKLNNQQQLISSLPQTQYQNLILKQENTQLQTQLLLLKNQLHYDSIPSLNWPSQSVKIINLTPLVIVTTSNLSLIQPGQPLVDSTALLGIVTEVKPPLIYITPLTHPDIHLNIQTLDQIQAEYIFTDQTPQITNLPSQTPIPENTTIYTLPTQYLPEGLIIGTTTQPLSNPQQPLQKIKIKLNTPINQAQNPSIITNPNP